MQRSKLSFAFPVIGPLCAMILVTSMALSAPEPPHPVSDAEFQFRDTEVVFTISVLATTSLIIVTTFVLMKFNPKSKESTAEKEKKLAEEFVDVMKQSEANTWEGSKEIEDDNLGEGGVPSSETRSQIRRHRFLTLVLLISILTGKFKENS